MTTNKTYSNTVKGWYQWLKDHPMDTENTVYKLGDDYYLEFRLNDGNTIHASVRKYNSESKTFENEDITRQMEIQRNNIEIHRTL